MKKNYTLLLLLASTIGSLAFVNSKASTIEKSYLSKTHKLNSSGSAAGRTGAPGETDCTACHSGAVQSGTGINTVTIADGTTPVTNYIPGTTYNIAVSFASASTKNGFQIVALNSSNAQAGSIAVIPGTGAQLLTGTAGKKYVTHTSSGNAQSAWAFQWTAPATNAGTVTFYLATNETNANGQSSGDIIRLSQHTIGSTAGVGEHKTLDMQVGFAASTGQIVVDLNVLAAGKAHLNLVDLSGKSVYNEELGAVSIGENQLKTRLPENIPSGIYVAHIGVNNRFASQKIAIQR